jgi:hypothetical protein
MNPEQLEKQKNKLLTLNAELEAARQGLSI